MAKQADAFVKISRKLEALQVKAQKFNAEISELALLVAAAQKLESASKVPAAAAGSKAPVSKPAAKAASKPAPQAKKAAPAATPAAGVSSSLDPIASVKKGKTAAAPKATAPAKKAKLIKK